ncbi:MAG TPA: hypothetical protein DGD08_09275 [Gemmatimonas aurantiaca]|uniref:Glycoside hydrolase family 38 central domain-containing protein n=2 Tax=Gemmatimonas aurantiaca TaxID=173480 RepID=C1A9B1_GEMAT|nr:hypothetical protein [Gemmatimonas aurantiaca]BAH39088.1 hypothetical protein GAU_2046 [Gemmatimonas aurantiaca T-27]HCT57386.1 hypothetical protein [Gemmatimonas aurantiaca]
MTVAADSPGCVLRVCVVSHTHWDREWYHGVDRFAQRLTALIDALLLPPATTVDRAPFLLDGQAITLRDYLVRRTGQREALRQALSAGRIEAGPWFVLGDNLIPSGEAIVRNLEAGRRVLTALGTSAPAVAYCPDTFGHPAAMPLIARGFGLSVAVVWRGAGSKDGPQEDAFSWAAPNGDHVATCHLPPDGYEYGSALPVDAEAARARWARLASLYAVRNRIGVTLLLNGADHHARQPDLDQALAVLQEAAGSGVHVDAVSLSSWAAHFRDAVAARREPIPTAQGELRDSYGYTWTLGGTLATRAHQKRQNARLERGLLRDVEPWLALARLQAHERPDRSTAASDGRITMVQLPDLLHHAWETLLETHPHDTLCGCSIDEVARAMDHRQEQVASAGRGLREAALHLVMGHDAVSARRRVATFDWRRLVLRNRSARPRGGVAVVDLIEVVGDVPVGPGSGNASMPVVLPGTPALTAAGWLMQPVSVAAEYRRRESPQHYPDNDLVRRQRTLVWVPPMPAWGVALQDLSAPPNGNEHTSMPSLVHTRSHTDGATTTILIDNSIVSLQAVFDDADQRGLRGSRLRLSLRHGARHLEQLLTLESRQDVGDSYTPALRGVTEVLIPTRCDLVEEGPLRGSVRIAWRSAAGDIRADTTVSLQAGEALLRCQVRGRNTRRDHRLQFVWHTDIASGAVMADAAFGPVHRGMAPRVPTQTPPPAESRTDTLVETVPAGEPMHRWVAHVAPAASAVMIADGLAEYEVGASRMALTLLRAVGALSRADLPERPGHAGWPAPVPAAQAAGAFRAQVALLLSGGWDEHTIAGIRDAADDVLLPLTGESWPDYESDAGTVCQAGPRLHGASLEASAVTVSSVDEQAIVLRVVNLSDHHAEGAWELPDSGPWQVSRCRLDESLLGPEDAVRGSATEGMLVSRHIALQVAPRDVMTLRVRRADDLDH